MTRSSRSAWARGPAWTAAARARGAFGCARFERSQHVAFDDAAIAAGAGDARRLTPASSAMRRADGMTGRRLRRGSRFGASAWARQAQAWEPQASAQRHRLCSRCAGAAAAGLLAFGDGAEDGADLNRVACLHRDGFDRAVGRRGHFHRHLVGFEFQQGLVTLDRVAFFLEPAAQPWLR